jgi:hypothetical protein
MVFGRGFNSLVRLKTRWIRWTTWWQKKNENNKDSQKGQVTPKNIKKKKKVFEIRFLVLYDENKVAKWASGTNGQEGCFCVIQDDGNLVIYNSAERPVWASNTCQTGEWRHFRVTKEYDEFKHLGYSDLIFMGVGLGYSWKVSAYKRVPVFQVLNLLFTQPFLTDTNLLIAMSGMLIIFKKVHYFTLRWYCAYHGF